MKIFNEQLIIQGIKRLFGRATKTTAAIVHGPRRPLIFKQSDLVGLMPAQVKKPTSKPAPAIPTEKTLEELLTELDKEVRKRQSESKGIPPGQKIQRAQFEKSPIQLAREDGEIRSKYFQQKDRIKNARIEHALTQSGYVNLFESITSNRIKSMRDLGALDSDTRDYILSKLLDEDTFNSMVSKCWSIHSYVNGLSSIARMQKISGSLSSVLSN